MSGYSLASGNAPGPAGRATLQQRLVGKAETGSASTPELYLKILIVALFIPEGFSFFIGDFRLTVARVLLMIFSPIAVLRHLRRPTRGRILSDVLVSGVGIWMLAAGTVTGGFDGIKGAGITAIEFIGCYYVFRYSLGPINSSVRIVGFACKVVVVVIGIALLDPLSGTLFTYELARTITGYAKPGMEAALAAHIEALFRDGFIRAQGPMEHSILFGCVCAWFGTLSYFTFPSKFFGWSIAAFAAVGLWFSQARGAWVAYILTFGLSGYYVLTRQYPLRWRLMGFAAGVAFTAIFFFSGSPIATLMRLGGLSPAAAWYREGIWDAALPLVAHSPLFGIGSSWDWQASPNLYGPSVDAFWLENSMVYGIPASLLVFLTMVTPFWRGRMDNSPYLSAEERRLSVALGIVTSTVVLMGFIVHFWGITWILIGAFPAIRANLAEAATLRGRAAQALNRHDASRQPDGRTISLHGTI